MCLLDTGDGVPKLCRLVLLPGVVVAVPEAVEAEDAAELEALLSCTCTRRSGFASMVTLVSHR